MGSPSSGALGSFCPQERISGSVPLSPSSVSCSPGLSFLPGEQGEVRGAPRGSPGHALEASSRRSSGSRPGLLQQAFSRQESFGGLETRPRCLQAQQVCLEDKILHGDHPVSPGLHSEGRLDDLHGYERCLLSCPDSQGIKTLPQIHLQQEGVSIPRSLFRVKHCSSSVHESVGTSREDYPPSRIPNPSLPRRLASHRKIKRRGAEGEEVHSQTSRPTGDSNQPGEISSRPLPGNRLSRDEIRLKDFLGFPCEETSRQCLVNLFRISILSKSDSKVLAKPTGSHVLPGEVRSGREAQDASFSVSSAGVMEQTVSKSHNYGSSISFRRPVVVVEQRKTVPGHIINKEEPRPSVVYRRVQRRLGCSSGNSSPMGEMVTTRLTKSYKLSGTKGDMVSSSVVGTSCHQQDHCGLLRQLDRSGIHPETGGHQITRLIPSCQEFDALARRETDDSPSSLYKWREERGGRYVKQKGPDPPHGMDSTSGGLPKDLESLGSPSGGYICYQSNKETTNLLFPSSGSGSSCNRRPVARLVQLGSLRLSPFCDHSESRKQIQRKPQLQNDTNCSMVASEGMVPRPVQASSGGTQGTSVKKRSSYSTHGQRSTPKPPHASLDRMETVLSFLRYKKRSSQVSKSIYAARGPSTNALYQRRWASFVSWCRARKLSASRPSINSVCEFLIFLFEEKKLAVSTIQGYRSTLHSVLRHTGLRINSEEDITDVIKSLKLRAPSRSKRLVHWNLDVLLRFLCSDKFEPLGKSSLLNLTRKTLILVALALSKRISELQALARPVGFSSHGALLSLVLDFRAKNDNKCRRLGRDFLIRELGSLVGQEEEALLCPVRALKVYLKRTEKLVGPNMNRLFVSPRHPARPASKNALSCFIRTAIKEAHVDLCPDLLPVLKVKPHELRAVSTSVAFEHNLSLQSVMEAAQWRCNSVFASHYLKDISFVYNDCRTLGPLLVAGSVVT